MATSKSGGSTQNGRDSIGRRLGVKLFDGQIVSGGEIIVRQRGTKYHPGSGVGMAKIIRSMQLMLVLLNSILGTKGASIFLYFQSNY